MMQAGWMEPRAWRVWGGPLLTLATLAGIEALREDDGTDIGARKATAARTAQIEARHGADEDAAHDCAGRRVVCTQQSHAMRQR